MGDSSGSGVNARIVTKNKSDNKRVEKNFAIDLANDDNSGTHLNSLRNCVNRLETQLNQYLTQIIDIENEVDGSGVGVSSAANVDNQPMSSKPYSPTKDKKSSAKNANYEWDDRQRQSQEPKQKKCKK